MKKTNSNNTNTLWEVNSDNPEEEKLQNDE
jgi:hypothetical protein